MADDVDRAASRTEEMQDALAAQARKASLNKGKQSAEDCSDCGDEIPMGRRLAVPGVGLCVTCQAALE